MQRGRFHDTIESANKDAVRYQSQGRATKIKRERGLGARKRQYYYVVYYDNVGTRNLD